jgi:predicted porin
MHRFPSPSRLLALAAVALLAAPAVQAQSTVTLFGLIDVSAGQSQAPGGTSTKGINSGNMTTSFFGVKGSEDLGGGLSAVFSIESFMRADTAEAGRFTGDTFWARNAYVGLSSGAGTLTLGRNTTSLFVNTLVFNAFGDSFGFSPAIRQTFTSGANFQASGDTGWSDSVKYASPRFGGLSFTAQAALGEGNGGRNYGLSAMYFGGPFGVGLAWQRVEKGVGAFNPDTTSWQLGGSYALAPFKLYAQYGSTDNKTIDNTTKVIGLGGEMVVGEVGKLMLQWGKLSPDVGADRKTISFGYDHQMSKRTDLYAVYMHDKLTGLGAGKSYAVGVRHRF